MDNIIADIHIILQKVLMSQSDFDIGVEIVIYILITLNKNEIRDIIIEQNSSNLPPCVLNILVR